jgi:hypothetical protein
MRSMKSPRIVPPIQEKEISVAAITPENTKGEQS